MWNKTYPGVFTGRTTAIDGEGNVYMAGEKSEDIYLVKVNQTGDTQWYAEWGGTDWENVVSIEINSNGDLYVLGNTDSFGEGETDIALLKYNKSGSLKWNTTWGYEYDNIAYHMVIDSNDDIFIVGIIEPTAIRNDDICIIKYDDSGTQIFNTTWGWYTFTEYGYSIALDSSNNIYISGLRISQSYDDLLLLVKFDSLGNYLWNLTRIIYNVPYELVKYIGKSLILDNSGNIIVSYFRDGDLAIDKYNNTTGELISEYSWDTGLYGQPSTDYQEVCSSFLIDSFNTTIDLLKRLIVMDLKDIKKSKEKFRNLLYKTPSSLFFDIFVNLFSFGIDNLN